MADEGEEEGRRWRRTRGNERIMDSEKERREG
jgi:hypothetical protein